MSFIREIKPGLRVASLLILSIISIHFSSNFFSFPFKIESKILIAFSGFAPSFKNFSHDPTNL